MGGSRFPALSPASQPRTGAEPCRALASNNSRVGQPSRPEFLVSLSAHHTARCRMESVTKGGVSAARHADVAARGVRGAADARTSVRSFGSYRRPPRKARRPRSLDEKTTKLVWTPSPGARGHSGPRGGLEEKPHPGHVETDIEKPGPGRNERFRAATNCCHQTGDLYGCSPVTPHARVSMHTHGCTHARAELGRAARSALSAHCGPRGWPPLYARVPPARGSPGG